MFTDAHQAQAEWQSTTVVNFHPRPVEMANLQVNRLSEQPREPFRSLSSPPGKGCGAPLLAQPTSHPTDRLVRRR